jgi:hypothetical protein
MSAGWSCYCWLLGNRQDCEFSTSKILDMLNLVRNSIKESPDRTKASMNNFVYTVGISYLSLHENAVQVSKDIGIVEVKRENKSALLLNAYESIQAEIKRGKLGFKRKYVRC